LRMPIVYSPSSRALQDQFDTRRLADRLGEVKVHDRLTPEDRQYIERMDMFFLATVDGEGQPTCSYKGGDPGFVAVIDDTTLAFPNYDGNGMYLSMGNLAETRSVGMLFIDFERQRRLRIDGTAQIAMNDPLLERYPEAQFIVRVAVRRVYPNCPRYIHKYQLVERSAFVPRADTVTPAPAWKQAPWACDVLPK
ncbi:MAG TPA: pyridoxamine 5'-phosphate oxidase family protein, partial [Thermoanaerobaculia bacterium]|nr:pyridoxamine 5'-phosphate oxidase family protein [Thermoanaerobaculia bacterium]